MRVIVFKFKCLLPHTVISRLRYRKWFIPCIPHSAFFFHSAITSAGVLLSSDTFSILIANLKGDHNINCSIAAIERTTAVQFYCTEFHLISDSRPIYIENVICFDWKFHDDDAAAADRMRHLFWHSIHTNFSMIHTHCMWRDWNALCSNGCHGDVQMEMTSFGTYCSPGASSPNHSMLPHVCVLCT